MRVTLQGVTVTSHAVDVLFNGTPLGTCGLEGQEKGTFSFPVPNVVEGNNQLMLTAQTANDLLGDRQPQLLTPPRTSRTATS